ncbi:PREDICTED: uncharacterized protein LOC108446090 [Corvus brachyrhynchos]|uniref:uncharacterized protein LOC108446090 n=1 Tax=Corvus brachyrhynchos TaxID=85066 RepID=UPI0008165D95|nr:PREDICTED: uncharacterized protein LOC108446090 [Corvus brachyrhynchos]
MPRADENRTVISGKGRRERQKWRGGGRQPQREAGGTSSVSYSSVTECRQRGKSHLEASLHVPPSHPVSLGSPMPSVIWDGNARELAQKENGAPLYALYVGGEKKKKIPPVRLSRSSVYNFPSISAPLTKPPPPLHVTQMCSGAVSVKRQREKDASGFLVQVLILLSVTSSHFPCCAMSSSVNFISGHSYSQQHSHGPATLTGFHLLCKFTAV